MPIDPTLALATEYPTFTSSWGADDVILYHLGIGAGLNRPADPSELDYCDEQRLKVLPSFAIVPAYPAFVAAAKGQLAGLGFDTDRALHGEQDLRIHRPLPTAGVAEHHSRITAVHDKGKAALFTLEVESREPGGQLWCTNRFSIFAPGEGGFGGEPGPPPANVAPIRAPDAVVESPTMAHQALIYRLSGDRVRLHIDPDVAKRGGFEGPILHGLCTYGIAAKAVIDTLLDGDAAAVVRYAVRFSGVVYPGETVVTAMWREEDRILLHATTKERGTPVLSHAAVWTH